MGVDTGGAGDQGMMFGYACDENESYADSDFARTQTHVAAFPGAEEWTLPFFVPTGSRRLRWNMMRRESATCGCGRDFHAARGDIANDELRAGILKHVIQAAIPAHLLDADTKYHINPTGRFVIGGPMGTPD